MDINLVNIGVNSGMVGAGGVHADRTAADSARIFDAKSSLTIGSRVEGALPGEPVAEVSADALTRDDKLGMLVNAAFNLPPPAMPDFR